MIQLYLCNNKYESLSVVYIKVIVTSYEYYVYERKLCKNVIL